MTELTLPFLSEHSAAHQYPFGDLARAGVTLAMGSDWSVSTADVYQQLEVAVTRRHPRYRDREPLDSRQGLTLAQGLRAVTAGSALVNGLAGEVGEIKVGMAADLAIADRNPFVDGPIGETKVTYTIKSGWVVFERDGFSRMNAGTTGPATLGKRKLGRMGFMTTIATGINLVTEIPGPRSREILARREAATPQGNAKLTPISVASAHGSLVRDVDGNQLIDLAGGIGVLAVGHTPDAVVEALQQAGSRADPHVRHRLHLRIDGDGGGTAQRHHSGRLRQEDGADEHRRRSGRDRGPHRSQLLEAPGNRRFRRAATTVGPT